MKHLERGVTLLEVLIAVTLLSLLSVAVLTAMSVGIGAVGRANHRFLENRKVLSAQKILEQQIAGMIPVIAECLADPGEGVRRPMIFFHGEPQSMRFVSSYSLHEASRGRAQVLEFQVIPRPDGRGARLVVNEWPFAGPAQAGAFCLGPIPDPLDNNLIPGFRPIQVGAHSFVLADNLAACRFVYKEDRLPPEIERWSDRWRVFAWPSAIRVEMLPIEPDPAGIQPVPLIAPVRVVRDPDFRYQDEQ